MIRTSCSKGLATNSVSNTGKAWFNTTRHVIIIKKNLMVIFYNRGKREKNKTRESFPFYRHVEQTNKNRVLCEPVRKIIALCVK